MDILQMNLKINYRVFRTFPKEYTFVLYRKNLEGYQVQGNLGADDNGTKRPEYKYRVGKTIKNDYRDAKKVQ